MDVFLDLKPLSRVIINLQKTLLDIFLPQRKSMNHKYVLLISNHDNVNIRRYRSETKNLVYSLTTEILFFQTILQNSRFRGHGHLLTKKKYVWFIDFPRTGKISSSVLWFFS